MALSLSKEQIMKRFIFLESSRAVLRKWSSEVCFTSHTVGIEFLTLV